MKRIACYFMLFAFLALLSNCKHDDGFSTDINQQKKEYTPYATVFLNQTEVNGFFVNQSNQLKQLLPTELG